MDDGKYIEYLLNKRIMRKTKNPETLHDIYANKYARWIRDFLNSYKIKEIPLFLVCNTLYKLPDTFRIKNNSFFVGDFYLFDYFYDWNYVLSDEKYQEFIVNLCIKQFIESCYLNDKIDDAYCLSITSDGLEGYKTEAYYDKRIMTYFIERTDIQEKFAFVHEAGHYLFRFIDQESALESIRDMYEKLSKITEIAPLQQQNKRDVAQRLFEECYCDSQAVKYIIEHLSSDERIKSEECYGLLFNTLFYIYVMMYIDAICSKNGEIEEAYFDYQLWELTYRIGNMYNTLYEEFWGNEIELNYLRNVYATFCNTLSDKMKEIRQIVFYIKEIIDENKRNIEEISKVSDTHKVQFIKEYFNLL